MKAGVRISKQLGRAHRQVMGARKQLGGLGRRAIAGAAGVALLASGLGKSIRDGAAGAREMVLSSSRKSGEVITMRKSTLVALLVALAAVAGVLGALYFYVLRREKELDEYEQLLFSEDFNDDLPEPGEAADEG